MGKNLSLRNGVRLGEGGSIDRKKWKKIIQQFIAKKKKKKHSSQTEDRRGFQRGKGNREGRTGSLGLPDAD